MQRKDVLIGDNTFTITHLSNNGFSVSPRQWREYYDKQHLIIRTVHSKFNHRMFSQAHTPIVISAVVNENKFSVSNALRILDCPIKFAGSMEYRIPRELIQFEEAISKIVSFEHSINEHVMNYYAYLTIDQGDINPNQYQRREGYHCDGFQGTRMYPKRPINRSYIVYDCVPTVFCPQKFRTDHLSDATDNFFLSFDEQALRLAETRYLPFSIVLMNAYTVHRSDKAKHPCHRTFLRVSFDTNVFDRLGNTLNPLFDYNWRMLSRDTQKILRHKRLPLQ